MASNDSNQNSGPAKPPLGLRPRHIAQSTYALERAGEISRAIASYEKHNLPVPLSWRDEYDELRRLYMQCEGRAMLQRCNKSQRPP